MFAASDREDAEAISALRLNESDPISLSWPSIDSYRTLLTPLKIEQKERLLVRAGRSALQLSPTREETFMIRLISAFLVLFSLAPEATNAAVAGAEKSRLNGAGLAIDFELAEALEQNGVARIEVTLDLNQELTPDLDHPANGSDVHSAVFDIAMMAAPGPMKLDQAGTFHRLRLAASEAAIGSILEMKEVLAVHLEPETLESSLPEAKASSCSRSETRTCLGPGLNSVSAIYGGVTGKVAAYDFDSATFWTYSPNNWEVLVKILDGCSINGHAWLLASAAGSNPYSIRVLRVGSLDLGSFHATNKPIVNLQLFPCP